MKKVVFGDELNKIHFSQITEDDYILVKKEGKIFGFIYNDGDRDWTLCRACQSTNDYTENLGNLLDYAILTDCEFYVL